jgi:hypothetical protein
MEGLPRLEPDEGKLSCPVLRGESASNDALLPYYDQIGGSKMVHAGCWSHAERYFSEAVQLNPQDPMATAIVARIDELFAIDAEARCQGLNVEARHALRQQAQSATAEICHS